MQRASTRSARDLGRIAKVNIAFKHAPFLFYLPRSEEREIEATARAVTNSCRYSIFTVAFSSLTFVYVRTDRARVLLYRAVVEISLSLPSISTGWKRIFVQWVACHQSLHASFNVRGFGLKLVTAYVKVRFYPLFAVGIIGDESFVLQKLFEGPTPPYAFSTY